LRSVIRGWYTSREQRERGEMANSEPPGEVPSVNVPVSGSQGVVIGSGNVQNNNWMHKLPLDPVALSGLNPHVAVIRLQELDDRELVDFFARAKPEDVSEILEVFYEVDLPKVATALADVRRRKAAELIRALDEDHNLALFDDLPEAAEAITRKATRLGWAHAGSVNIDAEGYIRKYKNGHLFWSPVFGTRATAGSIDDCIDDIDHLPWGFPTGDQETAPISPYGTAGVRQEFQPSTVYSSKLGVFLITDAMCYENEGSSGGWLGFPVSGRERNGQFGDLQRFEGGAIYSYVVEGPEVLRSFSVRREVMSVLPDQGWRPVSHEAAVVSSSGKQGTVQRFEIELESGMHETAVYWNHETAFHLIKANQPVVVAPEVCDYYNKLGAEQSWLGFPISFRYTDASPSGYGAQDFEQNSVYWTPDNGPHAVSGTVIELLLKNPRVSIGYPISEEQAVGDSESHRIQYFERGVVTMRDSEYEVWLPPDPLPEPGKIPEPPVGEFPPKHRIVVSMTTWSPPETGTGMTPGSV
jgi:LGFP repeat